MSYVILLTFFAGLANVQQKVVVCPTVACAQQVIDLSVESTSLNRIRVWRQKDFAPLGVSGQTVWPPIIDWELS